LGKTPTRLFGVSVMLLLCCAATPAASAEDYWDRPIKGNPDYADVRTQLQVLVNIFAYHKINHFCVVADHDPNNEAALVYWSSQRQLITWDPGGELYALVDSRDPLNLQQDVVADYNEVGSSTYLVTRGWLNGVLADCRKFGNAYTIVKTEGNWISIKSSPLFADVKTQLQTLVNEQATKKVNHFCVIGQNDGSYLSAYVYWPEENRLIMWVPVPDQSAELEGVDESYGADLNTGIVSAETYNPFDGRIPRLYAQKVLDTCQASGEKFTVAKSN
jgi:hypothetical protein